MSGFNVAEYERLRGTGKIRAPSRAEVKQLLGIAWNGIPENIVQSYFRKCGFTEDQEINIDAVLDLI